MSEEKMAKGFGIGILMGLVTILGCATTFPWRYYNAKMPTACYDQGQLLGKSGTDGWPDLALTNCKPDPMPSPGASGTPILLKCITMLDADFYSLKADDLKCHQDLQALQAHCPGP